MFADLVKLFTVGLTLWEHKDKTKYLDQKIRLEKEYYAELKKPDDRRSDARLDDIEHELRILASGWSTIALRTHAQDQS